MLRKRQASEENDILARVVAETDGGKKLKVGQYTTGHFYVQFDDGGQLPDSLGGIFLRYEQAVEAIKAYVASKPKTRKKKTRVEKDA